MITDDLLKVSDAQDVTVGAVSENTIDLSVARDIGEGENLYMLFRVDTDVTRSAGAATVTFQVIGSAAEALTNPVILGSSAAIAKADLTAGKTVAVRINPLIGSNGYRYLGAYYDVSATLDTGAFTATVVKDIQDGKKFYASGFSVA
jgi:hypothetical protein